MNTFKSSVEIKGLAREHMFGKYGTAIGASVIVSIITTFMTPESFHRYRRHFELPDFLCYFGAERTVSFRPELFIPENFLWQASHSQRHFLWL